MLWRFTASPGRHLAMRAVAALALGSLTLALAGPLLGSGLGGDPTYCCRAGRCCCDSGTESPDRLDFKTACSCARPGQAAVALGIPLGLLVPDTTLLGPASAERLAPVPPPAPRGESVDPPERPPQRALLASS